MKKYFFTLSLCLSFLHVSSQVQWTRDMKLAQAMALSQQKFIVMDFWASWCGPCRMMDDKMWNTSEMNELNDKFIFLKVDVDIEPSLARGYQATSIPKVIIIDPAGNEVWSQVGFRGAQPYMNTFKDFPTEPIRSDDFAQLLENKDDPSASFNVGLWYQKVASENPDNAFAAKFLGMSDRYLKVALKSDNEALALEADFNLILNQAYKGNTKKAVKKVEKMDETDMKNFILAYCYKCEGQTELMKKFAEKIKSEDLLSKLD